MFIHEPVNLGYKDLKSVTKKSGRKYSTPKGDYPSITTILGQLSKAAIMAWRDRIGHEEANKISRQAAGRGTAVHAMCEAYVNNDPDYAKDAMPNILFDFNRIKNILDTRIGIVYGQEVPLYSDHLGVAGRVDCVADYKGKPSIIDFKTSKSKKKESWVQDYFAQATAYSIMWQEMTGESVDQIVILISSMDGTTQEFVKNPVKYVPRLKEMIDVYWNDNIPHDQNI